MQLRILILCLLVAALLGLVVYNHWNSTTHHNVVLRVKKNMLSLQKSVEKYANHHGSFPRCMNSDLERDVRSNTFESTSFFFSKLAHSKDEALELAEDASPGQVVYCPISNGTTICNYAILGKDETGRFVIVTIPEVRKLVLTH